MVSQPLEASRHIKWRAAVLSASLLVLLLENPGFSSKLEVEELNLYKDLQQDTQI